MAFFIKLICSVLLLSRFIWSCSHQHVQDKLFLQLSKTEQTTLCRLHFCRHFIDYRFLVFPSWTFLPYIFVIASKKEPTAKNMQRYTIQKNKRWLFASESKLWKSYNRTSTMRSTILSLNTNVWVVHFSFFCYDGKWKNKVLSEYQNNKKTWDMLNHFHLVAVVHLGAVALLAPFSAITLWFFKIRFISVNPHYRLRLLLKDLFAAIQ